MHGRVDGALGGPSAAPKASNCGDFCSDIGTNHTSLTVLKSECEVIVEITVNVQFVRAGAKINNR